MSKLIAVRLPDDVAKAVESSAKRQERSQSQVVIRALRNALVRGEKQVDKPELVVEPTEPRKESGMCVHGRETKFCIHCKLKG